MDPWHRCRRVENYAATRSSGGRGPARQPFRACSKYVPHCSARVRALRLSLATCADWMTRIAPTNSATCAALLGKRAPSTQPRRQPNLLVEQLRCDALDDLHQTRCAARATCALGCNGLPLSQVKGGIDRNLIDGVRLNARSYCNVEANDARSHICPTRQLDTVGQPQRQPNAGMSMLGSVESPPRLVGLLDAILCMLPPCPGFAGKHDPSISQQQHRPTLSCLCAVVPSCRAILAHPSACQWHRLLGALCAVCL
jgi:hypothetical protein